MGLEHYLGVVAASFAIGSFGMVLNRPSVIVSLRSVGLILLAVIVTMGGGGPSLACSPSFHTPSDVPQRGVNCSVSYRTTEIDLVGLGQAQDFGQGIVAQSVFEGNGCYGETHIVVNDCNRGEALVLGTYRWSLMDYEGGPTSLEKLMKRIEAIAAKGGGDVLFGADAAAAGLGFTDRLKLKTSGRLKVNGRTMGLSCACRSYYPGLKPGS